MKNKIAPFFNALFINFRHLSFTTKIESVVKKMNTGEKMFFRLACVIFVITGITLLLKVNDSFLVEVPKLGGEFVEGLVGSPRFINPVLSISDTDKDLSALIYSGLLKQSKNGEYINDLASSYELQDNGTVYDFKIKDDIFFHDGKEVTADDVLFTVNKILDPIIKSPKKAAWEGVVVEKISNKEIKFILNKPYAPFLETLTVGILPKHIWENVSGEEFPFSELNINPIGSGPYKIEKIERNSGGIPTIITLSSFPKYALDRPKIKSIVFKFFQNENNLVKAHEDKLVESVMGISAITAKKLTDGNTLISNISLPRVFGVFFNQNIAPVFLNKEVREALDKAAPKQKIVEEVLYGFGRILSGPTPENVESDLKKSEGDIEEAIKILKEAGWKENEDGILEKKTKSGTTLLEFSITTSDAQELKKTAEILQEVWQKLGAKVDIKVFEAGDLSQNIIRGRKYDALLFGEMVGFNSDLYPFWHSKERVDPGLNVSLYANITVDKMLEEIQKETEKENSESKKEIIFSEIKKDIPAIFLFSPNLLYIPSPKIKNISIKDVSYPNERFLSIGEWYIETDKVWKFLAPNI